jgi:2,3-bisphosphoglycerate-independent phosphoglycerate mutase
VPLLLIGSGADGKLRQGGKLGDVAPTLLELMDMEVPAAMTGRSLLHG